MSFTSEIRQEVSYNELLDCCNRAELSALIQLLSSLTIEERKMYVVVRTENPTTAKRIISLVKKLYQYKTELTVVQKTNLKKNNIYNVKILSDGRYFLTDLGLYSENKGLLGHPSYSIVAKNCCARAYLAGAFIAYGSCNAPTRSNYHLEISLLELGYANYIVSLLKRFNIEAKISKRRNRYIVYIKKAESIADFFRLIGAQESLMNFENSRINRDFFNNIVRLDNCEIANEMKSLNAAKNQIEAINLIKEADKYDALDEKLKNVIDLRLRYPDHSLLELCEEYQTLYGQTLSKSGLKHRLNKIDAIARNL